MRCTELASLELPYTTIIRAEIVPPGGFVAQANSSTPGQPAPEYIGLPAFCRVVAIVSSVPDSEIEFELWMPEEGWNGNFVGIGDGGFAGAIFHSELAKPLARGYAVANTDGGHKGGMADATFAVGHPEKLIDHAWRAVHEMTVKSKVIVTTRYGRAARHSLWKGCSTGGRQALKEAQRFPEDYDAIAGGAPANNWVPLMSYALLVQQRLTDPNGAINPAGLALLKEAVIAACDTKDGIADRVINEPQTCEFDPGTLACTSGDVADCLAPHEIESARAIYAGVVHPDTGEVIFPGPEPGSEREWAYFTPDIFPIGENYFRDLVFNDREWDPHTFDFGADLAKATEREFAGLTSTDPDLSKFVERGGKLLLYHGWMDGLITPQNTINYYEAVVHTLGQEVVSDSVRLFMVPGMNHCSGGEGPSDIDILGVLEAWIESGTPPERVLASKTLDDGTERTRPLCPYPQVVRYTGSGSPDDADSFECTEP
ncbi:MAG: tannase/feruloyl esterase family alpha/beta hydrolase, partial [Acidobacteriota bacterium]